jgi:hypothetical protein
MPLDAFTICNSVFTDSKLNADSSQPTADQNDKALRSERQIPYFSDISHDIS